MNTTKAQNYCQELVYLGSRPLANLVMALASYTPARSVVELSESPTFHYQYSSIFKFFERELASSNGDISVFDEAVKAHIRRYRPQVDILRTHLDTSPLFKPHSPTLAERSHVYKPNLTVKNNKPVEIGYNISCLNQGLADKWSIPVDIRRVGSSKSSIAVGVEQLIAFADSNADALVVNCADSSYSVPAFIVPLDEKENVVNIIRLRNKNVYDSAPMGNTGGANRIYGSVYNLRLQDEKSGRKNPKTKEIAAPKPSIFEKQSDECYDYLATTNKGRSIRVCVSIRKNMMLRSKNKYNMKDKPFDLVTVEQFDAKTSKRLHKKPMYLAVCSKNKEQIPLADVYSVHYQHRYDIEPNNRFMKQQLMLDKFQTPIQAHLDLWLRVVQLAEWLLYVASEDVVSAPKKWQKYGDPKKQCLTIAQTRKGCQSLFLNFDKTPFLPVSSQISKKGKGRALGYTIEKKKTYPVIFKGEKSKKNEPVPT